MAQYECTCSSCGGKAVVEFGQRLYCGELIWSGGQRCTSCNSICEFDGHGEIPDGLRALILADEGEWKLVVTQGSRVAAMQVLRERLGLSLSDAKQSLQGINGTKTSLEWLQDGLRKVGVESTVALASPREPG